MKALYLLIPAALLALACEKADVLPEGKTTGQAAFSDPVIRQEDEDIKEDIIPDFSRVGYHYGDDEVPFHTSITATLEAPADGSDAVNLIQSAINACDGSGTSVIFLKAGTYKVGGPIIINRSNVVLRGEKDASGKPLTRLLATRTTAPAGGVDSEEPEASIVVLGDPDGMVDSRLSSCDRILDGYVPVGRMFVTIGNASAYSRGDRIAIYRPPTQKWVHDLKMDQISNGDNWNREGYNLIFERIVTGVRGDRLYLDNPIVMAIDTTYGGGMVTRYSVRRIRESGVEDICFDSVYDTSNPNDENHVSNAVSVKYAEHCWVRGIEGHHLSYNTVGLDKSCRNISVLDCSSYEPVSLISGRRRYAFCTDPDASLGFFSNCTADEDRHQFVVRSHSCGPTVYHRCKSTNSHADAGPHCYWAMGFLYDCLSVDGNLVVQDGDSWGSASSHGWQGVNQVFWNCEAKVIVCQSPWVSGQNWCVGSIGLKGYSTQEVVQTETEKVRPDGKWYPDPGLWNSNTEHFIGSVFGVTTTCESLYESQLAARKASGSRVFEKEYYNNYK